MNLSGLSDLLWSLNSWFPGIWAPDWSQFVPDVVNTLLVGLVAALLLAQFEQIQSKRSARSNARRYWRRLQLRLRQYFVNPVHLGPSVHDLSTLYGSLLSDLQDEPIQDWSEHIKDPALAALVRLEGNLSTITGTWQSVNVVLQSVAQTSVENAHLLADRRPQQMNTVVAHAAARMLGHPLAEEHLARAAHESGMSVGEAEKLIREVEGNSRVRIALTGYDQRARQVVADTNTLRKAFELADGLTATET